MWNHTKISAKLPQLKKQKFRIQEAEKQYKFYSYNFQVTSNGLKTYRCSAAVEVNEALTAGVNYFYRRPQCLLITHKSSLWLKAMLEQTVLLHPTKHCLDNIALQEVHCCHIGKKKANNKGRETARADRQLTGQQLQAQRNSGWKHRL